MIIAIDGPAGAGKSTTARAVARRLGFAYIDTGAMYRAIALAARERGLQLPRDGGRIAALGRDLPLNFGAGGTQVSIAGRDVSAEIRAPEIGSFASQVAAVPELRAEAVARQRQLALGAEAACGGAVLEGRDIQTVVFPDAAVKIFLTASSAARATRRLNQWQGTAGANAAAQSANLEAAERDVRERDERDSSRAASPLQPAPDAVHLVTDDLTPEQVVDEIVRIALARGAVALGQVTQ